MFFSTVNSVQSFGKTPLMNCRVDDKQISATLYKMDPNDAEDRNFISDNDDTACIANDFETQQYENFPGKEFFLLQNDKTGEVISCAQISHHYKANDDEEAEEGQYTLIEEADENKKYEKGASPILAFIAKQAANRYEQSVTTSFDEQILNSLNDSGFIQKNTGVYYLPSQNFSNTLKQAKNDFNIRYLV